MSEIRRKDGLLVFKRYRLFESKWFNLYLHKIYSSDVDHPHNHPWNFVSFVLWGAFYERYYSSYLDEEHKILHQPFSFYFRTKRSFHKNRIIKPVTSLVLTFGKKKDWGYLVDDDEYYTRVVFDHKKYRELKNKGVKM